MSDRTPCTSQARRFSAWALVWVGGGVVLAVTVGLAARSASNPARCPPGTIDRGQRCCLDGQRAEGGHCLDRALRCPDGFGRVGDDCVVKPRRVRVMPVHLVLGPGDWEAQGVVTPREVDVGEAFDIDATEVTVHQWQGCAAAGRCRAMAAKEAGLPVRAVAFDEAMAYCRWAGGSLAQEDQWLASASGASLKRYPWRDSGAVCRRACWGLLAGPCASGGTGPDLAGLHGADRTPSGVQDLAGSVAEWVVGTDGKPVTLGGSWRSRLATELRTWRRTERTEGHVSDDVGVRCVYR